MFLCNQLHINNNEKIFFQTFNQLGLFESLEIYETITKWFFSNISIKNQKLNYKHNNNN